MLFTKPRKSAGKGMRGSRLEELHLPWRRDTSPELLIFRQICRAGTTAAAFLTLEQPRKQRIHFLNQEHEA